MQHRRKVSHGLLADRVFLTVSLHTEEPSCGEEKSLWGPKGTYIVLLLLLLVVYLDLVSLLVACFQNKIFDMCSVGM